MNEQPFDPWFWVYVGCIALCVAEGILFGFTGGLLLAVILASGAYFLSLHARGRL